MNEILIPILCVVVGLLIGVIALNYFKNKDKDDRKSKNKKSIRSSNVIEKTPMEFSKKILVSSYVIAVAVILYTMYIIHLMVIGGYTGDPSSLNTLIMLTLGELGAANSFYFWKSKLENKIKLESQYGRKTIEENEEDIV